VDVDAIWGDGSGESKDAAWWSVDGQTINGNFWIYTVSQKKRQ